MTAPTKARSPGSITARHPWLTRDLDRVRTVASLGFLVLLYATFGILEPSFLSADQTWTLAQQGSVLLLVSLGATFVMMMGMIDLSVGSLVALAAMTMAVFVDSVGVWAIPIALFVTTLAGAINGLVTTLFKLPSFLVTLGTLSAIQGAALLIGNSYVAFDNETILALTTHQFFGRVPIAAVWAALLFGLLTFVALFTVFGRGVYSIGGAEEVATIAGIPVRRYKIAAFALSAFTCGMAGIIIAGQIGAGTPSIGSSLLLDSIAAIAVGGTSLTGGNGGPWSTVIGAAIVTILSAGLVVLKVDPNIQEIIKGMVVIGAVFFTLDRKGLRVIK